MSAAYPKRIGNVVAGLMLATALTFDGLQFLLTLTVFGSIASPLITFVALCIFALWFLIYGINYIGGRKAGVKLAATMGTVVAEMVPFINGLPAITAGVLGILYASRKEDEENAEITRKRAQRQAQAETARQRQLMQARAQAMRVQAANDNEELEDQRAA